MLSTEQAPPPQPGTPQADCKRTQRAGAATSHTPKAEHTHTQHKGTAAKTAKQPTNSTARTHTTQTSTHCGGVLGQRDWRVGNGGGLGLCLPGG